MLHYYVFMLQSSYSISLCLCPTPHPPSNYLSPHQHGHRCSFISPPFLNLLFSSASSSPSSLPLPVSFHSCLFSTLKLSECPEFSWLTPPVCLRVFVYARVCACRLIGLAWRNKLVCFQSSAPHPERSSRQLSGRSHACHARRSRIFSFILYVQTTISVSGAFWMPLCSVCILLCVCLLCQCEGAVKQEFNKWAISTSFCS